MSPPLPSVVAYLPPFYLPVIFRAGSNGASSPPGFQDSENQENGYWEIRLLVSKSVSFNSDCGLESKYPSVQKVYI